MIASLAIVPFVLTFQLQPAELTPPKLAAIASVETHRAELVALAARIWGYAETALHERQSCDALATAAEAAGFAVERGVAGLPTAFVARFGKGHPVIGILAEYDALPGLSQKAVAEPSVLVPGAPGHGCGHNLFGAASLGAAIAVKERIQAGDVAGTVVLYGTPAEEAVGGKIYMARAGLFDELDVCLAWHPGDKTLADTNSSQALVDFVVEFTGRTAHAAGDPWNGRSALDGAELFTHGLNMMREHILPTSRIHYVFTRAGDVPNVVPAYAKVWVWMRDWKRSEVDKLLERAKKCAAGAAMMAEVEAKLSVQSGDYERMVLTSGARLLQRNLLALPPIAYSDDEQAFARQLQRACAIAETGMDAAPRPLENQELEGGSTDVGDVSWIVPTLHVTVACAPLAVPWHAWPVVASSGSSIGHKGMEQAAKVLALTALDLFTSESLRTEIRAEFDATRGKDFVYRPYIPEGPPPLPAEPATPVR